jgi:hypothetical protein
VQTVRGAWIRFWQAFADPKCRNGTRVHAFGEQDPDGGVWCVICGQLVSGTNLR